MDIYIKLLEQEKKVIIVRGGVIPIKANEVPPLFIEKLKETVTEIYIDISFKREVLALINDEVTISNINYKYADTKFRNNTMEVVDFSEILS